MPDFTLTGYTYGFAAGSGALDEVGPGTVTISVDIAAFTYALLAPDTFLVPPASLSGIGVGNLVFNNTIGFDATFTVRIGSYVWGPPTDRKTTFLMDFYSETTDETYSFVIGGDPLPQFDVLTDFFNWTGELVSIGPVTEGPFAPGEPIEFAELPGVQVSGGPICGTDDPDTLFGTTGDDTMCGEGANDSLSGRAGDDRIAGNSGDDTLVGGRGRDTLNGGHGSDWASYTGSAAVRVELAGSGVTSGGDAQGDVLLNIENLLGSDGNDTLQGDRGANQIKGARGDDRIFGLSGNDTLRGGDGADFVNGGLGDDTLYGDSGDDTLLGGFGKDSIDGGFGDDNIKGGADADLIFGLAGNDFLVGGDGDDTIRSGVGIDRVMGGEGNDSIATGDGLNRVFGQSGNDTIRTHKGDDVVFGGAGDDFIRGSQIARGGSNRFFGEDGNDTLNGGLGSDFIDGGADNDQINGDQGNDTLLGGAGDDSIKGGIDADEIFGQQGNDILSGGSANDVIFGGPGHDTLSGGFGDDRLNGGGGRDRLAGNIFVGGDDADTLTGGTGADTFVFSQFNTGQQTITDWEILKDRIEISVTLGGSPVSLPQLAADIAASAIVVGGNTVVDYVDKDVELHIVLLGVTDPNALVGSIDFFGTI